MKKILAMVVALILAGCATTQQISQQDRSRIQRVVLNEDVEKIGEMFYLGPGSAFGMMFGAVGGALTAVANMGPGERLAKYAEDNAIFVEKIVAEEVKSTMQASGKFPVAEATGGSVATVNVRIVQWGFSIPNGFSSKLVPAMAIRWEMVDSDGKLIWAAQESASILNSPATGRTVEEINADPKLIEQAWRIAARKVSEAIVSGY